ncbi:hypothetical protein A3A76_01945 [Candidatus Woesebacteria bacterium RIFCSPLOWO2_01_FULL_39_23]|uniref:Uncharacterized protein n=1 Tax=Candidatus Woesebacteria bacterium RIFCSPHIGHO2_01_FULL_40_22 TaxID=1802499 RepID=A0A1F7YIF2_9BACT|nr:MAG: hypothetical protein A2141_05205 [Candidatus Woesebacteria bacterium RBG_16_40_11]OGM26358.1 MAG: hypothetical protein A2628_03290 [Candidatus Woesebacteria bacterium RIFCSPHIGHO2_01_FULL_40_22]OGM37606.1 MAG: hypothetical protein A3E41_05265 [Candidatus Woesebacteria bacterium RIFCSPHIGHO2_12_FULL_38_9]OGM61901.1 MAG: hypothetical protein A3A76_01945 [Candidatus Woesebacteria bacterium RIFCSPLOWO2_01_FULL_39_23]
MKHDPNVTANAAAITVAALYIVCRVAVALFPDLAMSVAQSWFHGLELSKISGWDLSMGSFVLGLITSAGGAWLVGYGYATVHNFLLAKK